MLECREIVWAPFPFSNHTEGKHRPTLIISGKNSYGDLIWLPVTSTQTANSVGISSNDLEGKPGLDVLRLVTRSFISLEQPMTLDADLFDTTKPTLAILTSSAFDAIKNRLMQSLCA
jgi:hypothetical protein